MWMLFFAGPSQYVVFMVLHVHICVNVDSAFLFIYRYLCSLIWMTRDEISLGYIYLSTFMFTYVDVVFL